MKVTATGEHAWRKQYLISPEIWLDGVQLHSVIEADDVEGYVIHPVFNSDGSFEHQDGEIVTRRRTGKVAIVGGHRRPTE